MGIFLDIIEENRERGYDPCNPIASWGLRGGWLTDRDDIDYKSERVCKNTTLYKSYTTSPAPARSFNQGVADANTKRHQKLIDAIKADLVYLEGMKLKYIVTEKVALWVLNRDNLQCPITKDILDAIIDQSVDTYRYLGNLKSDIGKDFLESVEYHVAPVDETSIKKDILNTVVESVDFALRNGLVIERALFIALVEDIAILIDELLPQSNIEKKADKRSVEKYFETQCKVGKGMVACPNCKKPLIKDFPYCFNCFDRKEW